MVWWTRIIRDHPPAMEEKYWNPVMETLPIPELRKIQEERVRHMVRYVYYNSPLYHKVYKNAGFHPDDIRSMEDFQKKVPIIRKDDLRKFRDETGDPYGGILCAPRESTVTCQSSGTTGDPTFSAFTTNDEWLYAETLCRAFWSVGLRPGDRYAWAYVLYHSGGLAHWRVRELMKIQLVQTDLFDAKRTIFGLKYFKPVYLEPATEFHLLAIEEECKRQGIAPAEILGGIRIGEIGGEPLSKATRERIEKKYPPMKIQVCGGLPEFGGLNWECGEHDGLHGFDDISMQEVLDPETGEALDYGEKGEIILTNLWKEGTVAVRYGTDDIGYIEIGCPCGRTHLRVYIQGRRQFLLKLRNKSFLPWDIVDVIESHVPETNGVYRIVKYAPNMDTLKVQAEYTPNKVKDKKDLSKILSQEISEIIGVATEVELLEPGTVKPITGWKYERILDLTKKSK